ncbi:MAG TPA: class I SAM-dependent methyltransferase [Lachnoclostridium phytofermentans]|uniref:Class I SAM-dependent methyltransferase n=1 Tax=Lachnoclostridium phytofermentans TaxID=66219 RepID=A0A3D2X8T5_9FIRM|nr:class I SAM-dependent methyltransferase [Lachnoclostridium sp.]HCL02768.1 class I SAM-dependent methyltransferase [Lachnoclostridium phytofermentans]
MKEYDNSIRKWNEVYSGCKTEDLTGEQITVEPMFDTCLQMFAKECQTVIDFGCGTGDILFQCAEYGYLNYGLGIDRSDTGITFCKEMAKINHFKQLDFVVGDITYVSQMEDESFDGVILSNVLDVVPNDVAVNIYSELSRLIKPGGLLFLKLNPYLSKDGLKDYEYTNLQDNLYEKDGVLTLRQLDTLTWRKQYEQVYQEERYLEFIYPWQQGLNRLFLLRKKNCMKDSTLGETPKELA